MLKAIVFDFDGLIVDTETAWFAAYQEIVREYGGELPLEEFAKCIGTTDEVLHTFLQGELKEKWNKEHIEEKVEILHREKMKLPVSREGVNEYLEEAKKLNLKIGLASSSSRKWVTNFLKELGLQKYFEVIKTKEDVLQVKPDPALYVSAVNELGVHPSEVIAFEDSVNGARAAVAAGLKCVIVPNEVTKSLSFETHHLRLNSMKDKNLAEVIEFIKQK
ncbi:HAD family hydrolase [Bacillus sp. AFS018417]|uniref:HAD family hydrolase n=1 Tax=unclassified Bacillus (in: firmicutes) TaxID=185979 RepID=UPI000BF80ECE|nr:MULTISPECIES: HAD family hydrolase [unclassified Bacillus (in: firmicutes)]MCP1125120.1 HAD family hydrolase [Bacillus sp. 3103sda1]PEZ07714.1 HAD family hydrolase [Bacillus sp. AFS018417]